ncbi:MAG: hypothetical protein OEV37_02920 [Candidatus Berkelbacteria bacterium]|nr:hypothetical protein [Candidatus Berkelbacteria bacterium]
MERKLYKIIFICILVAASFGLRFYFLPKQGFSSDIGLFLYWGERIADEGLAAVYNKNAYYQGVDYPFLIPLATSWLVKAVSGTGFDKAYIFKLIPTAGEIVLLLISGFLIVRSKIKYKWLLLVFALIQPPLALVTSAWGQVDSLLSLSILISFLLINKNSYLSTFFLFLGILLKPQALPAIAIFFLYFILQKKYKEFALQFILFLGLFLISALIFRQFADASFLDPYIKSVGRYDNSSLNAFNLWWAVYGRGSWDISDKFGDIINLRQQGLIIFSIFFVPVLTYLGFKKRSFLELCLVLAYTYLIFFVFPTEIHERYLYPAVVFFALSSLLNKRIFIIFLIISASYLVNVFSVLQTFYPQFGFLRFDLLEGGWTRVVAIANVLIAFYLAMYLIYESFKKVKT